MILKQVLDIYELLDRPDANGEEIANLLRKRGAESVTVTRLHGNGYTDNIKVIVPGSKGKSNGGNAPTLGVIGRLGGVGARPGINGFVSDGDGALTVLAAALKLIDMTNRGDLLPGDIIVSTHICPDAPLREHKPVTAMGSPINMSALNNQEVSKEMEAILSVGTTRGNNVINYKGVAISLTIKAGYILKASDDLLTILEKVTGRLPMVLPVAQQDITPYGNGLYHINSIFQPSVVTEAPVVGVAITSEKPIAGCATGVTQAEDIEKAGRFIVEVAKLYGKDECQFYDQEEYKKMIELYGKMTKFQSMGLK